MNATQITGLLQRSPLIGNIGPLERSAWRAPVGFGLGVVAGTIAAMIAAAIVLAGYAIVVWSGGTGVEAALNALTTSTAANVTLTVAIAAVATIACANAAFGFTLVALAGLMVKQRVATYLTSAPRFRWRHLAFGLGLTLLAVAPLALASQALGIDSGGDPRGPPVLVLADRLSEQALYVVASVGLLLLAAAAEEVVFRGWLLRQLSAWIGNVWVVILVSSGLFAALHVPQDLTGWAALAVMGATFGWMALRLGGVEYAIGAHAAHNIAIILFLQPMSFDATYPKVGRGDLLFTALMCAVYLVIAELFARRQAARAVPPT